MKNEQLTNTSIFLGIREKHVKITLRFYLTQSKRRLIKQMTEEVGEDMQKYENVLFAHQRKIDTVTKEINVVVMTIVLS